MSVTVACAGCAVPVRVPSQPSRVAWFCPRCENTRTRAAADLRLQRFRQARAARAADFAASTSPPDVDSWHVEERIEGRRVVTPFDGSDPTCAANLPGVIATPAVAPGSTTYPPSFFHQESETR